MNHGWTYPDAIKVIDAGVSILDFYSRRYTHSTRETWQARLDGGEMTCNGNPVDASYIVREGDKLEWHRPPWEEGEVPTDFRIIYQDDAIIAVDKPAGLPVLPDGGFLENTLVHMLCDCFPSENIVPAHRLNRGTSGLILFSRTKAARRNLAAQFRDKTARYDGEMVKIYHAKSMPYPGGKVGDKVEITTPIGPVPHPCLGLVHAASPTGRPSCSRCEIIEVAPDYTLWKVDLVTGRPHQIRIHLASIGVPLVDEPLFLPGGSPRPDALPGDCGYYLRSMSITFRHPVSNDKMKLAVNS